MNALQAPQALSEIMDIANPYLFACANGIINTETGKLLAFHPSHLCSRASKAAFRGMPQAGSRFEKFLLDCFNGDTKMLEWYQLFCGYCMTADIGEQMFLIKQGAGASRKSLTKLANFEVLGSYVVMSDDCIIEAGKRSAGSASSHIMALRSGRLAETDESGEKAVLNEAAMKAFLGSGTATARELHSKQEKFQITVKTVLNTNYRPILQVVSYCVYCVLPGVWHSSRCWSLSCHRRNWIPANPAKSSWIQRSKRI